MCYSRCVRAAIEHCPIERAVLNTPIIYAINDKSVIQTVVHGLPFLCPGDSITGETCYDFQVKGGYEPCETRLLALALKPGHIAVDAGANIGYFTVLFARIVGSSGKVFSFEPEPYSAMLLRTNVEINNFDNVEVFQAALGDTEGTGKLYLNPYNAGDHRTWNVLHEQSNRVNDISINVTTLDKALSDVPRIDIMKVDVQGDEERVLRGAREIISRSPGMFLLIEYWPFGIIRSGGSVEGFLSILYEMGFYVSIVQGLNSIIPTFKEEIFNLRSDHDNVKINDGKEVLNLWCSKGR